MKFLLVTGIYPPAIGGPATVIAETAQSLRAVGHEVTVITYGAHDEQSSRLVRVSHRGGLLWRYLRLCWAVRTGLTDETLVVATDVFSVGLPVRLALVGQRQRLLTRLGGEWVWEDAVTKGGLRVTLREYWAEHAYGARHFVKRWLAAWVLRRAQLIIVTSDILRAPLERIAPSMLAVTKTVYNIPLSTSCIPTSQVYQRHCEGHSRLTPVIAIRRMAEKQSLKTIADMGRLPLRPSAGGADRNDEVATHADGDKAALDVLRVLYAGRFAPVKNMPFFCRALKNALDRGARLSITFVGDGEEREECEQILRELHQVEFLGSKTPQDVFNWLSEADLYVLPSLTDICPNGVLEALSCGVPCLVTREHGLPKDLGGLMELDPKDETAWTKELIRFASDRSAVEALRAQISLPAQPSVTLVDILTSS